MVTISTAIYAGLNTAPLSRENDINLCHKYGSIELQIHIYVFTQEVTSQKTILHNVKTLQHNPLAGKLF